jgi:hypothetical protein
MKPITNDLEYFDSRDILRRIDYLENFDDLTLEENVELLHLKDIEGQWNDDESFRFGVIFVREDYFAEYVKETAQELGYIDPDKIYNWPFSHIDWEAASEDWECEYIFIDFNGTEYLAGG